MAEEKKESLAERRVKRLPHYGVESGATVEELKKELRRAGKAANQRLRRLEQNKVEGIRTSYGEAYAYAKRVKSGMERPRFMERPGKNMTVRELRDTLAPILAFLGMLSSTETGRQVLDERKYAAYQSKGFLGTFEEFKDLVGKVFDMAEEKNYSSNVAYTLMTTKHDNPADQIAAMNKWLEEMRAETEEISEGKALINILRAKQKQKGG